MYTWVVYLHVTAVFVFLVQHAADILVTYKLRQQTEPEGIYATYSFMLNNNVRNLRITYLVIIVTGAIAGVITPWWRQGWMWTALGVMILIWIVMKRAAPVYLTAVDTIAEEAMKNKADPTAMEKFKIALKARREPEIMAITSVVGLLIILWLMMFKPF
jgi:hypothetical protein